jgi:hypothetical protein
MASEGGQLQRRPVSFKDAVLQRFLNDTSEKSFCSQGRMQLAIASHQR